MQSVQLQHFIAFCPNPNPILRQPVRSFSFIYLFAYSDMTYIQGRTWHMAAEPTSLTRRDCNKLMKVVREGSSAYLLKFTVYSGSR